LRPQKALKERRGKLYSTLALTVLLYGSENWTRDARRITAAEIKRMRTTAGYICTDYKTNTEIIKGLNIKYGTTEEIGYEMVTECLVINHPG